MTVFSATIFPDACLHIGGDENNGVQWAHNPHVQAFMKAHNMKDAAALQAYFNQRLLPILSKHGKTMIGWDEILVPGLPKDVIVQSWRGFDSLGAGARQGYQGILSAGYYLDFSDEHYLVDPVPANSGLTAEEQARILGGEACLWAEFTTSRNIDLRLWPRTAIVAERLWSPQTVNNTDDMYRRLHVESLRLEALGLSHLTTEDAALRQLAGTTDIEPLRVLAGTLEPVLFQQQGRLQHPTQLTPMDRLVDALPFDAPPRHQIRVLVRDYLAHRDIETRDQLHAIFASWIAAGPAAQKLMAASPLLVDALPRAQQAMELGAIGQQALTYLDQREAAPAGWAEAARERVEQCETPVALTRFNMLPPLRDLLRQMP